MSIKFYLDNILNMKLICHLVNKNFKKILQIRKNVVFLQHNKINKKMETKQELRDKIAALEKELELKKTQYSDLYKTKQDLDVELRNTKANLDSARHEISWLREDLNSKGIFGAGGDEVKAFIQDMINDSIKKLSLSINCDWGGYVTGELHYGEDSISTVTDQIITSHNPLDD